MDHATMDVPRQIATDEIRATAGGKHDAGSRRKAVGLDQPTSMPPANLNTLAAQLVRRLLIQVTGVGLLPSHATSMRLEASIKAKTDLLALDIGVKFEATVHPLDQE